MRVFSTYFMIVFIATQLFGYMVFFVKQSTNIELKLIENDVLIFMSIL